MPFVQVNFILSGPGYHRLTQTRALIENHLANDTFAGELTTQRIEVAGYGEV